MRTKITWGVLAVALVAGVSLSGQLATFPNLMPWYEGLVKPSFNPPRWVFAPVWTALYVLMACSFWRIGILPQRSPGKTFALSAFLFQLFLNAAWSWMFFGAQSPFLGLLNIVPQLIAVVATIGLFWRLDRLAGALIVPLGFWVAYATALNFAIYRLNG